MGCDPQVSRLEYQDLQPDLPISGIPQQGAQNVQARPERGSSLRHEGQYSRGFCSVLGLV